MTTSSSPRYLARTAAVTAVAATIVAAFVLIAFTFDVLLLVFAAVIVAVLLRGLAARLGEHLPLGEGMALGLVALLGWVRPPQ